MMLSQSGEKHSASRSSIYITLSTLTHLFRFHSSWVAYLDTTLNRKGIKMSSSKLFQQLFNEGKQLLNGNSASLKDKTTNLLKDKNINTASAKKLASGFGGGMAAGGILGSLLGSKKGRKYAGTTAKWGSLAALGGAAYYAYQKWQSEQNAHHEGSNAHNKTIEQTEIPLQTNTDLLLDAMVSAARADGHIDEQEQNNITAKLSDLGVDTDTNILIENALRKPLDPAALAARVTTMEQACEVYLISYAVIDVDHFMEKAYLEELQKHLNLPIDLVEQLKQQI